MPPPALCLLFHGGGGAAGCSPLGLKEEGEEGEEKEEEDQDKVRGIQKGREEGKGDKGKRKGDNYVIFHISHRVPRPSSLPPLLNTPSASTQLRRPRAGIKAACFCLTPTPSHSLQTRPATHNFRSTLSFPPPPPPPRVAMRWGVVNDFLRLPGKGNSSLSITYETQFWERGLSGSWGMGRRGRKGWGSSSGV